MTNRFSKDGKKLIDNYGLFTGEEVNEYTLEAINYLEQENLNGDTNEKIALFIAAELDITDEIKELREIISVSDLLEMMKLGYSNPSENLEYYADLEDEDDWFGFYGGKIVTPNIYVEFEYSKEKDYYESEVTKLKVQYGDLSAEYQENEQKIESIKQDSDNFLRLIRSFREQYGEESTNNIIQEINYGNIGTESIIKELS